MEIDQGTPGGSFEQSPNDRVTAYLRDQSAHPPPRPEEAQQGHGKGDGMEWREEAEEAWMEGDELERKSDLDDEDEMADVLGEMGLTNEQLKQMEESKASNPGMFVSSWEEDDKDVEEKNMKDPNEQFLTAAEEGNLDTVRRMLTLNPLFLQAVDSDEYTALHRAAYNNHVEVVRYLLEAGADPEARTVNGWTVLHSAAIWANYHVVGALLSHGVVINALSNGNLSALHLAVSSQEDPENVFHTVRYLLQAPGIDVGIVNNAGDTPLALARRSSKRLFQTIQDFVDKV